MKAAVLTKPEKIEIREVDDPIMKDTKVLVKIKDCGICTLEQKLYRGDLEIFYPIIPGHEASGEIIEVGERVVGDFSPGMRVAMDLVTRCGQCYFCRTGQSNLCTNRFRKGQQVLGGFGEYISVYGSQVYPVSDSVSLREAAFAEPVSCCIRSLKKVGVTLGENVLIIGAGPMGLMHLQVARSMGARVFISDPDKNRLAVGNQMGAYIGIDPASEDLEQVIKDETDGIGVDVCIVTSPSQDALVSAYASLSNEGRMNIFTSYLDKPPLPADANTLHRHESLITGSAGRTVIDFHQAVKLIGYHIIDVKPLVSMVVGYEKLNEGFKASMNQSTFRVLLEQ